MLTGHKKDKRKSRKETLDNGHKFFKRREMIIDAFNNGLFPLPKRPPSFQGEHEDKDKEFLLKEELPKFTADELNKLKLLKEKRA